MISLELCKKILCKNGKKYTDEQIKQIREYLYQLAKIDIENFKNLKSNKNERH
jgi:hypothetical protein